MSNVVVLEKIEQTLYVTNLKLSVPQKSVSINPIDLLEEEIAIAWGTDGARVSFMLPISEKVNEFINIFTTMRRDILSPLMFTGHDYLIYESDLSQYLEDCKDMDEQFAEGIGELMGEWDAIRDDFQDKLATKMRIAIAKKLKTNTGEEIDAIVEKSVESYMSSKFPCADFVMDRCGVVYETPRLFRHKAPSGLTEEARKAWEKSQLENTKLIYDLLVRDYDRIELDFVVGYKDDLISSTVIPFDVQSPQLRQLLEGHDFESAESEITFDSHTNNMEEESNPIRSKLEELKNSRNKGRYTIATYRNIRKDVESLGANITNSLSMLGEVVDKDKIEKLDIYRSNLIVFSKYLDETIKNYKPGAKKSVAISVSPAIDGEDGEIIDVTPDMKDIDVEISVEYGEDIVEETETIEVSVDNIESNFEF